MPRHTFHLSPALSYLYVLAAVAAVFLLLVLLGQIADAITATIKKEN